MKCQVKQQGLSLLWAVLLRKDMRSRKTLSNKCKTIFDNPNRNIASSRLNRSIAFCGRVSGLPLFQMGQPSIRTTPEVQCTCPFCVDSWRGCTARIHRTGQEDQAVGRLHSHPSSQYKNSSWRESSHKWSALSCHCARQPQSGIMIRPLLVGGMLAAPKLGKTLRTCFT